MTILVRDIPPSYNMRQSDVRARVPEKNRVMSIGIITSQIVVSRKASLKSSFAPNCSIVLQVGGLQRWSASDLGKLIDKIRLVPTRAEAWLKRGSVVNVSFHSYVLVLRIQSTVGSILLITIVVILFPLVVALLPGIKVLVILRDEVHEGPR